MGMAGGISRSGPAHPTGEARSEKIVDVVVDMRVHVGAALFGVYATLDHMKQVWDHTACCESLSLIIEVEPPWVRQSAGIHFKFVLCGVITPDAPIDKLSRFIVVAWFSNA